MLGDEVRRVTGVRLGEQHRDALRHGRASDVEIFVKQLKAAADERLAARGGGTAVRLIVEPLHGGGISRAALVDMQHSCAVVALDHHLREIAAGDAQHLPHRADRSDLVKVRGVGLGVRDLALGDEENILIVCKRGVQRRDGHLALDLEA